MVLQHIRNFFVRLLEQYYVAWRLYKNVEKMPRHMTPYYNREQIKIIWNYANTEERRLASHRAWHTFLMIQMIMFAIPGISALPESADNLLDFSQDIMWTLAALYIISKFIFYFIKANQIDEIIDALEELHHLGKRSPCFKEIQKLRRWYYIVETVLSAFWHGGVIFFNSLLLLAPIWTGQALPFHAVYPFQLHNPLVHPITHKLIFLTQAFCVFYFLPWLLMTEHMTCHCFFQLAVNLQVLCIELRQMNKVYYGNEVAFDRELKRLIRYHQRMIRIVDRINDVLYSPLLIFLLANFLLLLLCAFMSLASRHQPLVAGRFIMMIPIVFGALTYWSKCGDLVTQSSQEVALAAFEAYDCPFWTTRSSVIQRDIMFLIQRSQVPLNIGSRAPLPAFNLVTCMALLKQCYGILTILLKFLD